MKLALICPSNILYMPYVKNYIDLLDEKQIPFIIINWDRFQMESEQSELVYRDNKVGHQRNYFDYYKYKRFIIKKIKENEIDKVIVFGLQLGFFLEQFLLKFYKGKYAIDIRDHNKIINYFSIKKLIKSSSLTVISSPEFISFLPSRGEYTVNHNTKVNSLIKLRDRKVNFESTKRRISYIGALRDFQANVQFINSLKSRKEYEIKYHGEGIINKQLSDYVQREQIENVILTGRYTEIEEEELYLNSDLINVMQFNDDVNNKALLPNRLYLSGIYKKPLIALNGSYLAEIIKKYRLGLVIESFEKVEKRIEDYIIGFNEEEYEIGVNTFFQKVISDNRYFKRQVSKFLE